MKRLCVLVAVLAVVLAVIPAAQSMASSGSWTGWITDDHCGAKGAKAGHEACAKKCLDGGGKLVFYNNADKKLYALDKQDLAKEHLGHEVKVTGEASGDSIKVTTIEAAPTK